MPIILGDCREILPMLDAGSVDVIVTDPPYGETSLAWDGHVWGWATPALRVLKPSGSMWVFGSLRSMLMTRDEFSGWKLCQDVIWEKHNGSGFASDRFRRVHEIILQRYPQTASWADIYKDPQFTDDTTNRVVRRKERPPHFGKTENSIYVSEDGGPRLQRSVIFARSAHGNADHETQKPEAILGPLILYSCPPGGTVLDPFAGSGATCATAERLGRKWIGIELDPKYAQIAEKKTAQMGLA
jgi:site-specific DNA-methyltransferase (adenine-specific)